MDESIKNQLSNALKGIVKELTEEEFDPQVSISEVLTKGDFSTNIAMLAFSKAKNIESPASASEAGRARSKNYGSPMELAQMIVENLNSKFEIHNSFRLIEAKNPGFINFWLSNEELAKVTEKAIKGIEPKKEESSLVFEFGDPNPFKEPHIGHLRNLVLGESLSRLFEFNGIKVIRANYQGDVGMHVAKAIWGIKKNQDEFERLKDAELEKRAKFLGRSYQEGAVAFEKDDSTKEEIVSINNKIYIKDAETMKIWETGRKWSLDYFEQLYKKLGVKYEKYYFESEVAGKGRAIVENNLDVFETDEKAFVFRAEQYGLHTRVFVNSLGHPTYEAKDLALAFQKNEDFPDAVRSIIMTANEQIDYFNVLLKALEKIDVKIATKNSHLSFGFVNLKEGKMSSRNGNIVNANWLIDETKKSLKKGFKEVEDGVLDELSVGAVKWSMLKFSRESDIAFSIEDSIDLAGHSGPYMQYTYARIASLLVKSGFSDFEAISVKNPDPELVALMRLLCQFETVVKDASDRYSPNHLTEYLFHLAQSFNTFYEKEKIIGNAKEKEILTVLMAVKNTIGQGLKLLGISTPEKI